jgi:hypothetical protein
MRFTDKNGNVLPGQKWYSATQAQVQAAVDARIKDGSLVVGDVIPEENVAITTETTDVDLKANGEWTDGIFVNANGSQSANAAYTLTDFYPAAALSILSKKANYSIYICYYASDKSWLGRKYSGYTTANEPLVIEPLENAAFLRVNMAVGYRTDSKLVGIHLPMTIKTYDWQNTADSRMNQLAVRKDLYSRISGINALLWNYTKWSGKTVVVDGNSLVHVAGWGESLARFLGMTCVNLGRSGQGLVFGTNNAQGQAVYPNVWTDETIRQRVANDYPAQADLIMLQGDSNGSQPSGSVTDQMDGDNPKTTWYAKINYLIRCLKAKYPNAIIVIMPDQVRYDRAVKAHELALNHISLTTMREVAEYNRLAFYDFEHATPFNPLHEENNWYSLKGQEPSMNQDYVHASGTGGQTVYGQAKGKALAQFVSQLIFDPNAPSDAVENWVDLI